MRPAEARITAAAFERNVQTAAQAALISSGVKRRPPPGLTDWDKIGEPVRRVQAHGGEPTDRTGPLLYAYLFQRPGQTRMTMRRRRHLADRSLARSEQTAANCTYGKSLNLEEMARWGGFEPPTP